MNAGREAHPPVNSPPPALPELRLTRLDDYPQIERLESSHNLLPSSADDWRGFLCDHPYRRRIGDDWPIGWVLEDHAGRIVGSIVNIPSVFRFRGRELI